MFPFRSILPKEIIFGRDKAGLALPLSVKGKNVLVLGDRGVRNTEAIGDVLERVQNAASSLHVFWDVPAEPTEYQVAEVVAAVDRPGLDAIIAVGGGSVMDMAKFVSVMVQGGPGMEYLFAGRLPEKRKTTLIMVPTTAGTGSEATANAIALRPAQNLKVGVVCDAFMADQVILDPELVRGLPQHITASTGMDTLCHALECYVSNKANPMSDMFALESMRLTFKSLRTAYADGNNIEARGDTLLAALYGGVCIASSGTTAVHALSYPLGGRFRIPHGVANAVLLAATFACNKDACADKLAIVAELAAAATGSTLAGRGVMDKADYLVECLAALARELHIPASLEELGVKADDLDWLTNSAFEVKRLLDNNPKPLSKADIKAIYTSILTRR